MRLQGSQLKRWTLRLDLLDEAELEVLKQFFEQNRGRAGTFSFTDPWDGTVYSNCRFQDDELTLAWLNVGQGQAEVMIQEIRA
jgi:hypothetical protein